jgi:hypothetical protein
MTNVTATRKKSNAAFIAIVVVLVAALAVEGFILARTKPKAGRPAGDPSTSSGSSRAEPRDDLRPAVALQAIASSSNKIETFGAKSAPIKIDFYAPLTLEWHQKTISLLRHYDEKHPGAIFVTLMPMGNSECDQAIQKRGVTCAAIFINGKNEFTLPDGRKVELYQRPNQSTSTYKSEDVITILDQMAAKQAR